MTPKRISATAFRKNLYKAIQAVAEARDLLLIESRHGTVMVTPYAEDEEVLMAMAMDRSGFRNKVEEKMVGAMREYYKSVLARREQKAREEAGLECPQDLAKLKWVVHWESEARRLVDAEMRTVLISPIVGFKDRRKAFEQARDAVLAQSDRGAKTSARNEVKRDFKLPRLAADLTDGDTAAFFKQVNEVADEVLP